MLGKIIGAVAGGKIAKQTSGIGGTTGAMLGAAAPFVLSRLTIPGMVALGVGGYVVNKMLKKTKGDEELPQPENDTAPVASVPQPAAA
ncbi:hypothetical protein CD351_02755 [Erythrobacter sp. KY5]|uniref:hypothetical protein n=1 Tax=Erythrobacter sp. KY5 TaxID=2011159 RepID=UPI000DBF3650|nr:hypothetical protein [Erythrobacter sp. KY5]AWW73343.1 hypothetical protein CD351_02755 [Erythrobacter sp. KY5]